MFQPRANDTHRTTFVQLFDNLVQYFDLDELCTLCFDLGLDYDELRGPHRCYKLRATGADHHRDALAGLTPAATSRQPPAPTPAPQSSRHAAHYQAAHARELSCVDAPIRRRKDNLLLH